MKRYTYEILSGVTGSTFQLPVFLEASVDEMGIMSGFDGEIEQVEQFANFTYKSGFGWSAYGYYTGSFGSSPAACSSSAAANGTLYIKEQYSQPTVGQYLYVNPELTTPFIGGYQHWRMQRDDGQWYAVFVSSSGYIMGVTQCAPIISSPTPTPTESPCPVNPSVTPSITPTKSIPATPSVTPTTSPSPTPSVTASPCPITPTPTPTVTPSITVSPSVTTTPSVSTTPAISTTPTRTPSVSPTRTPSVSPTRTPSVSPTRTPTVTPSITVTPTRTSTPTPTPSPGTATSIDIYNEAGSGYNIVEVLVGYDQVFIGTITPGNNVSTQTYLSGTQFVSLETNIPSTDVSVTVNSPAGLLCGNTTGLVTTIAGNTFNGTLVTVTLKASPC